MSIAAVILAAGFSRRLGRPKQGVQLGGETLLARAIGIALAAGLEPVLVVVQPDHRLADEVRALGAAVVLNHVAEHGLATSIRTGVQAAAADASVRGAVLMTCDQVLLRPEHLLQLCAQPEEITGSSYAGRTAVPAYFPRAFFPKLAQLQGDVGAQELLRGARGIADENLSLDIDTEEDLRRALHLLESPRQV